MSRLVDRQADWMRPWVPFLLKALGTLYLLEAPLLLVMRTLVLMFVPSKSAWTDEFHGFQYRTWSVVLALAAGLFFASGVACWVLGVRLGRNRPHAARDWRYLLGWLILLHVGWLGWVLLTNDRLLVGHLLQAVVVFALAGYAWWRRE